MSGGQFACRTQPRAETDHDRCPAMLEAQAADDLHIEVVVLPKMPSRGVCDPVEVSCPHGDRFWMRPSGRQIASWRVGTTW